MEIKLDTHLLVIHCYASLYLPVRDIEIFTKICKSGSTLTILLVILDIVKYILVLSFIDDEPRQLRYVLDNELFLRLSSLRDPEYFVIN